MGEFLDRSVSFSHLFKEILLFHWRDFDIESVGPIHLLCRLKLFYQVGLALRSRGR
jgi:hypothetical protein